MDMTIRIYPLQIWSCKIGECPNANVPRGADNPMRDAVADAYKRLTGREPSFIFSGWNAELTESERAAQENRMPDPAKMTVAVPVNTFDQAREALKITAHWMQHWMEHEECDCDGIHICARSARQAELDNALAVLAAMEVQP